MSCTVHVQLKYIYVIYNCIIEISIQMLLHSETLSDFLRLLGNGDTGA